MNSRHTNIQFTFEEESNDRISFLDILITRSDNKLTTSLYQKKDFQWCIYELQQFPTYDL